MNVGFTRTGSMGGAGVAGAGAAAGVDPARAGPVGAGPVNVGFTRTGSMGVGWDDASSTGPGRGMAGSVDGAGPTGAGSTGPGRPRTGSADSGGGGADSEGSEGRARAAAGVSCPAPGHSPLSRSWPKEPAQPSRAAETSQQAFSTTPSEAPMNSWMRMLTASTMSAMRTNRSTRPRRRERDASDIWFTSLTSIPFADMPGVGLVPSAEGGRGMPAPRVRRAAGRGHEGARGVRARSLCASGCPVNKSEESVSTTPGPRAGPAGGSPSESGPLCPAPRRAGEWMAVRCRACRREVQERR